MQLQDTTKQKIRAFYEILSKELPSFKARSGQRQMIGLAATTISNLPTESSAEKTGLNIAVIEGRTGVGKTLGYLVPGLVMAVEMNKTVIISSATVALQEQIIDRDLPAVLELFPDKSKIRAMIAKGRNRYACTQKLNQLTETSKSSESYGDALWERPPRSDEMQVLSQMAKDLRSTWSGDRDELSFTVNDELWGRITNDSNGCPGATCQHYEACPFVKSRIKMRSANVLVTNHDFLLLSLKSESKSFPDPTESIFLLDECHHLPEIAIRRFACSHLIGGALSWIEKVQSLNAKIVLTTKDDALFEKLKANIKSVHGLLTELESAISHSEFFPDKPVYRYQHGTLDAAMQHFADSLTTTSTASLQTVTETLQALDNLRKESTGPAEPINKLQSDLGFYKTRLENLNDTWRLFASDHRAAPIAKWLELKDGDILVSASPLSAADTLTQMLWSRAGAVVMASATITTLGNFNYFLENTGLDAYPDTTTLAVKSPFDFATQGQIYLPKLRSNPKDPVAHAAEIISLLPALLSDFKGSLVLFSSKRQMKEVYDALSFSGAANTVLMQGDYPKRELLKIHEERINMGLSSAIFGLAGFGEGIDLRGKLCEQVIITKIPFAPPDSPVETALHEWVESRGGNSFDEVSLPKAGLKLTQWVGRLIRSETDVGRIVFLDSRMVTAKYKNKLLNSLPEFSIVGI